MSSSAIARRVAQSSWRVVHPGAYHVDKRASLPVFAWTRRCWTSSIAARRRTASSACSWPQDNDAEATLRHGWREVAGRPCAVAAEFAQVLLMAGWQGVPRACGVGCACAEPSARTHVEVRDR